MNEGTCNGSKERIIEAAKSLFSEKGYDGAKMSELAIEADVKKALIYHYFPTKQSILDHIIDGFFSEVEGLAMGFIQDSITKMIDTGRLDILPDRMRFATPQDSSDFRQSILAYYRKLLEYMLSKRHVLRIILSEAIRGAEQKSTLFRFFLMMEKDKKNPLFDVIHSADADFTYSGDTVFRKFFFSLMPQISFVVFHDDYKEISGLSDDEMIDSFLRTVNSLYAGYFDGRDMLIEPRGEIDI